MNKPLNAVDAFLGAMRDNTKGVASGIYSVCSAHPLVIDAAISRAVQDSSILCIESTSNQVDQFGGYTGLTPAAFAAWIYTLAAAKGLEREWILLGGDHLGPNAWRSKPAEEAMILAEELVRQYVAAGYLKIHLDCSMPLGGDTVTAGEPLPDTLVAQRAARLCRIAEAAAKHNPQPPIYIIGTEVPVPGGATHHEDHIPCTTVAAANATITTTREIFAKEGVGHAWSRVVGAVVQPGVEFGDDFVFDFKADKARDLSQSILKHPGMVFEAHSTDYQTVDNLLALVRGHFAILKVGPWLTFAMREGIFALLGIESALAASGRIAAPSQLASVIDEVMAKNPKWWKTYYLTDVEFKKRYSFSDRIRYYWGDPAITAALDKLFANLDQAGIPESLLGQFFPDAFAAVRAHHVPAKARDLVRFRIDTVLRAYAKACGQLKN